MSYVFSDPFDSMTAISQLSNRWDAFETNTSYGRFGATSGRTGGPCLIGGSGGTTLGTLSKNLPRPLGALGQDAVIMSVSLYLDGTVTAAAGRYLMSATNTRATSSTSSAPGNSTSETWVTCGISPTDGVLVLLRSNVEVARGTTPVPLGEWKRIEMRVANLDDSGAVAEVRLNGVTEISYTGDLYNAGQKQFYSIAYHTYSTWRIDDVLVLDSSGTSLNGFLGDVVMDTVRPTGPGTTTQSTPTGAASSWQAVADVAANGDTSYAAINTVGNKDTYVYGDLPATVTTILGVVTTMTTTTRGMAPRKIAPVARLSGAEADGTPQAVLIDLTTGYRTETAVMPRPGGGTWTPAEVNAAEFGWKVTQ